MANKKTVKRRAIPANDRMRFLRRRVADGTASAEESAELEGILASKPKAMDELFDDEPSNSIPPDDAPLSEPEQAQQALPIETAPVSDPVITSAPKPPPAPHRLKLFTGKIPVPGQGPKVERDVAQPKGKPTTADGWKAPYLEAAKGAGREATVLFLSSRWIGILETMSNSISAVGVKPLVDIGDNSVRAMIVLTVDDLLPANVILKPAHMAAWATTTITGQTFYHRKAIAAHEKAAKEAAEMQGKLSKMKEVQFAAESAPRPPSPPRAETTSPPTPPVSPPEVKPTPSLAVVPSNGATAAPKVDAVKFNPDDVH